MKVNPFLKRSPCPEKANRLTKVSFHEKYERSLRKCSFSMSAAKFALGSECMGARLPRVAAISAILFALLCAEVAAEPISVVIETRIRKATLSFQSGMKSRQTLTIDFDSKKISNKFETGVTSIGVADLKSIRDKFILGNIQFVGNVAAFKATGQTASGVYIMPNIDYKFDITVDRAAKEVVISGCHDGYPSYTVSVGGTTIYDFQQEFIGALLGDCDTNIPSTTKKF